MFPRLGRNSSEVAYLSKLAILEPDATKWQTISQCKDLVAKRTGGKLDVPVNNAGRVRLLDIDVTGGKRQ